MTNAINGTGSVSAARWPNQLSSESQPRSEPMTPTPSIQRNLARSVFMFAVLLMSAGCHTVASKTEATVSVSSVSPVIHVSGDIPRSGMLSIAEMESLGAVDIRWEHDGEPRESRGVNIEKVIRHFGWDVGAGGKQIAPKDRRPGWRCVVIAKSADGFRAVYSTAELTAENGPTRAFIVWKQDGKPLDPAEGPLRIIVPTDKKGSRAVRQLVELQVMDLGK